MVWLQAPTAGDGNEALRVRGTERIDVAVLDVMMPGPNGLSLCRTLRQGGDYTLREALAESVNLVSVRVCRAVGVDKVRELAARVMNIPQSRLDPYLSLALGVSSLSPLEQASGYATFASGGLRFRLNSWFDLQQVG